MNAAQFLMRSPAERALRQQNKQDAVLRWLRDEIWSTPELLAQVMGLTARSGAYRTLAMMEREGFLRSAAVPIFNGMEQKIFGITSHGLAHAYGADEPYVQRPTFEPSKVKLTTLQHELDIQMLRLRASRAGWQQWIPGARLGIASPDMKRPDAVVRSLAGEIVAIEVERTIKTLKRYEVLMSQYFQAISKGQYTSVVWLCPTLDLASRLLRILRTIQSVPVAGTRVRLEDRHARLWAVVPYEQWLATPTQSTKES